MKTIPKVSEETLRIERFIKSQEPGTKLSYNQIEDETNVKMDVKGKTYLRTAFKRAKLEYAVIRSYGVQIADPDTVMPILNFRLTKIDNAVKRGEKSQKNLQEKFFQQLDPYDQQQILLLGGIFGAIRANAENGRKLGFSKKKRVDPLKIELYNK